MTTNERLTHLETLMIERHTVQKEEFAEIKEMIRKLGDRLDSIEKTVNANRAEHDKVVNRGWGILSAVAVAAGFIGALAKSWFAELFGRI
jgi:NADH:ubiquinone oxidoreductase subunit D